VVVAVVVGAEGAAGTAPRYVKEFVVVVVCCDPSSCSAAYITSYVDDGQRTCANQNKRRIPSFSGQVKKPKAAAEEEPLFFFCLYTDTMYWPVVIHVDIKARSIALDARVWISWLYSIIPTSTRIPEEDHGGSLSPVVLRNLFSQE